LELSHLAHLKNIRKKETCLIYLRIESKKNFLRYFENGNVKGASYTFFGFISKIGISALYKSGT